MILAMAALGAALGQAPEPVRIGIFVGDNDGNPGDLPLLFAASDARKMRDLFVEYGSIDGSDAALLQNVPRRQVEEAFAAARRRIAAADAQGRPTTLVFYYSGHGDGSTLHLGTTQIGHVELRSWLDDSGADVRIGMLDACQSGSAIRSKGGSRGPSYEFDVALEQARGTAILTSSAASETSQESAEVGGGFFTHYLHSGLSGAADSDRDGEVTLTEAYAYVHGATAAATRDAHGTQTPGFDFDLVGTGDVALTSLETANAHIAFLGDLSGVYAIWDDTRKRYVAEVDGSQPASIAVRPGTYYVHERMPGYLEQAQYVVRREETRSVYAEDFERVAYQDSAARGPLDKQIRKARLPDLALRAVFGVRGFGQDGVGATYLPTHPIAGVDALFLSGTGLTWYGADLLTGGGPGTLSIAGLGDRDVSVGSSSIGISGGFATRPHLLRAGIGGCAEWIWFRRSFPTTDDPAQGEVSVAPGVDAWAGVHSGRFQLDLRWKQLWYAGAFDGYTLPSYAEPGIAIGYRF